ncbi:hypothetical protein DAEQUDRAFT_733619 [Daedalea quercina L-15889]|uniref:Uncharacterized protein n=1 Tax=Daedalea quercina L-15889 TaxID=1314783 RepID=A0A165KUY0_9APHY|nr:hypothetical protein DAEQUDRAFT_733619 [Daedalea quercina L-15889]
MSDSRFARVVGGLAGSLPYNMHGSIAEDTGEEDALDPDEEPEDGQGTDEEGSVIPTDSITNSAMTTPPPWYRQSVRGLSLSKMATILVCDLPGHATDDISAYTHLIWVTTTRSP